MSLCLKRCSVILFLHATRQEYAIHDRGMIKLVGNDMILAAKQG